MATPNFYTNEHICLASWCCSIHGLPVGKSNDVFYPPESAHLGTMKANQMGGSLQMDSSLISATKHTVSSTVVLLDSSGRQTKAIVCAVW